MFGDEVATSSLAPPLDIPLLVSSFFLPEYTEPLILVVLNLLICPTGKTTAKVRYTQVHIH